MMNLHRFFLGGLPWSPTKAYWKFPCNDATTRDRGKSHHFVHQNTISISWIFKVVLLFLLFFGEKRCSLRGGGRWSSFADFFISRFFPFLTWEWNHWSLGRRSPSRSEFFRGGKLQRKVSTPSPRKKVEPLKNPQASTSSGKWVWWMELEAKDFLMPNAWLWVDFLIAFQEVRCSVHRLRCLRIHSWRFFFS